MGIRPTQNDMGVRPTQLTATQYALPIVRPCDYLFLIRYNSEMCRPDTHVF